MAEFSAPDAFSKAAQARSYKNEIIFMTPAFSSTNARDMAINSLLMLRRLGFSHWLLMMHSEAWCHEAAHFFNGDSGCVHFDLARAPYSAFHQSIHLQPTARTMWLMRCGCCAVHVVQACISAVRLTKAWHATLPRASCPRQVAPMHWLPSHLDMHCVLQPRVKALHAVLACPKQHGWERRCMVALSSLRSVMHLQDPRHC